MLDPHKKFSVPLPYLGQKISKELRVTLFENIVKGYKTRFPNLKPMLAYLNWDPSLEIDFLFMVEATNTKGMKFVLYDLSLFGARRSIPGYRYCILNDIEDKYFEDGFDSFVPIHYSQFEAIITKTLGLSLLKTDENYWKKPEYLPRVMNHLREIAVRFVPQTQ